MRSRSVLLIFESKVVGAWKTGESPWPRDILSIFHGDRALEKMLEFKEPLRRVNVFVRRGPTHGGLVHVDILGHVAQHHRFESLDSMIEKLLLEFENALSDAIESLLALLNAFDQPSGCTNFL